MDTTDQYNLGRALLAFSDHRNRRHGSSIHCRLLKSPPRWSVPFSLFNKLLNLYCRCGDHHSARDLFDEMPERDAVSYNTVLPTVIHGRRETSRGLKMYGEMRSDGISPNNVTLSALIGVAESPRVVEKLHCDAVKIGGLNGEVFVGASLVGGYARFSMVESSIRAFEEIGEVDLVCWNVMLDVCVSEGDLGKSVRFLRRMRRERGGRGGDLGFDYFTLTSIVKTCTSPTDIQVGKQLHGCSIRSGFFNSDAAVGNALLTMYSTTRTLPSEKIFWEMHDRTIVTWTAMISTFTNHNLPNQALSFYTTMLSTSGLSENQFCFAAVLSAVSASTHLTLGLQIHGRTLKSTFGSDVGVRNALIDMYFKCGGPEDGRAVFDQTTAPVRDRVTWTTLISGLARHGKGHEAIACLEQMVRTPRVRPDHVTFLAVLTACSHAGLVGEGGRVFNSMVSVYGVEPNGKHYACMVDLLGRAGKLKEAEILISKCESGFDPGLMSWESMVGMCELHGDVDLGRISAQKAMEYDCGESGNVGSRFVALANLYARCQMWEEKAAVRRRLDGCNLKKTVGRSWSTSLVV